MKNMNNARTKDVVILVMMFLLILIVATLGIAGISGQRINNGDSNVRSDRDLNCYFTVNETMNVNVTWYVNGVQNLTTNISCTGNVECSTSSGAGMIPDSYTIRNEIWKCSVLHFNGASYITTNVSVTIDDSPPTQPRIFFNVGGTEVSNATTEIYEDNTTIFNVTSSDADNDVITYIINDTTFCNINANTGILTCTPTLESHVGPRIIRVGADTSFATVYYYFNINVTSVNDPPRFSPNVTAQNLTEGQVFNYYLYGADDEFNTPYNVTLVNVTPYLDLNLTRINDTIFVLMLQNNRTATFIEALQNYTVTLRIEDNSTTSKNTTVNFNLTGIAMNHLPNVSYIIYNNLSLIQGGNLSIFINATDIDNNTLTFSTNSSLYNITYTSSTTYDSSINSSTAYAWINITGLTNEYVINPTFRLYVFDTNENTTQVITMNINNTNDAPILHEISNNAVNTLNNVNLSNLMAYTGVLFTYQINATDPDSFTYDSSNTGINNYTTNNTDFTINLTTGLMQFTPLNQGSYLFTITVTDKGGLTSNRTANLTVLLNNNPSFNQDPIIIYCNETDAVQWPYNCYYNISSNVTDSDLSDYIASYYTNSTFFTINSTTGIINFTVTQSMVGNHSIRLNVTDTRGGKNSTIIYLIINNTNNVPSIFAPTLPSLNMVVGNSYQIVFNVNDTDLYLINTYENLTFNMSISGPSSSIFTLNKDSDTQASIIVTPTLSSHAGNYSINFTVTDYFGNYSNYTISNLFIYNQTNPPTISQVIPTGTPLNDTIDNATWQNTSDFPGMETTISIYENKTYLFNQTSTADTTYTNSLDYYWYYDGSLVATTPHYSKSFNFFSSGQHNLTFVASDDYGSNNSFTWRINITNVNRPPTYNSGGLENLTIGGSISVSEYMTYRNSVVRFYDPDDDINEDGRNTGNETRLNFSVTSCQYASFAFQNSTLVISAESIGECTVIFTARDFLNSTLNISSELIRINITNVSSDSTETVEVEVTTQSSGGGTNTQPIPIPIPEQVEKPKPLQIITPNLVTVYKNASVKIPLVAKNTWNSTLTGITIDAFTNASNVNLSLDRTYIQTLDPGQSVELTLLVENYKSEGHYEIAVTGNVADPKYLDTATILINSADMRSEGEELESKINFARDLLSSNPECQELNELLTQAKRELGNNNYDGTARIVDNVINGCKFLLNNKGVNIETPSKEFVKLFEWKKNYNEYAIIALFGVMFAISIYYIFKKDNTLEEF